MTKEKATLKQVMNDEVLWSMLSGANLIELYAEIEYELAEGWKFDTDALRVIQHCIKNLLLVRLGEPLEISEWD